MPDFGHFVVASPAAAANIEGMNTTRDPTGSSHASASEPQTDALGLVIAACKEEPWRVGEVARFPDLGIETYLGRGSGAGSDVRAVFIRQRPTGNEEQPPLS